MRERDKLIAQAEALKEFAGWLCREIPGNSIISDPNWWAPRIFHAALRALAAQQPEAVEHPLDGPKCEHGYPLSAPSCPLCDGRPQASAPADHTAFDLAGVYVQSDLDAAEARGAEIASKLRVDDGSPSDLDALVAWLNSSAIVIGNLPELPGYNGSILQIDATEAARIAKDINEAAQAITDLRARSVTHIMLDVVPGFDGCGEEIYAKSVKDVEQCMSKMGIQIDEQAALITDLRTENEAMAKSLSSAGVYSDMQAATITRLEADLATSIEETLLWIQSEGAKNAQKATRIAELEAENAAYKAASPLCEEHKPNGGTRGTCLVCACIKLSAAIDRIDYACGEPNEMEVSGYTVHCNEDVVIENVKKLKAENAEALELLDEGPDPKYETEYDGQMMNFCSDCILDPRTDEHQPECWHKRRLAFLAKGATP